MQLYALSNSRMMDAGKKRGLATVGEVFGDRGYMDDGTLAPRGQPGGMIEDATKSVAQVMSMVDDGIVVSLSGKRVPVSPGTLCLHGDQPGAATFAKALRKTFADKHIKVAAP